MNPLRVAVIGAGYWGPNLVRNLNEAPGAEPVAVADLSQERLDAIHKRFPAVRTTTDHTALFDDKNIDAVAIATPVRTHRKLVEQALAAGKHVFVEKPLAATSTDGEAMVRAAEKAGRTMTVIGSKKMAVYDDVQAVERVKVYDFGVESLSSEELRRSYRAGDIHSPR